MLISKNPCCLLVMLFTLTGPLASYAEPQEDSSISGRIERTETVEREQTSPGQAVAGESGPGAGARAENPAPLAGPQQVARFTFTTGIASREPVDSLERVPNQMDEIHFFTELRNMSGETAVHRWEYGGRVQARVAFRIGGPRWRVWSHKWLKPEWTGTWTVSVLNTQGDVLQQASFEYLATD